MNHFFPNNFCCCYIITCTDFVSGANWEKGCSVMCVVSVMKRSFTMYISIPFSMCILWWFNILDIFFPYYSGFIFIRNPFEDGHQRYWIERCVLDYPNKPSKTILDNLVDMSNVSDVWLTSQKESGWVNINSLKPWS